MFCAEWRAALAMAMHGIRHVLVLDAEGKVRAALTTCKEVDDLHQTARDVNLFTELTTPLAVDWSLITGMTWLHQTRDVDDLLPCNAFVTFTCIPQNESFNETYEGHIGRIGVLNDFSEGAQLFTNFSQSFRATESSHPPRISQRFN